MIEGGQSMRTTLGRQMLLEPTRCCRTDSNFWKLPRWKPFSAIVAMIPSAGLISAGGPLSLAPSAEYQFVEIHDRFVGERVGIEAPVGAV
jgi:hypothetical protein